MKFCSALFAVAPLLVACSSSNASGPSDGGTGGGGTNPKAYVTSSLTAGAGGATVCGITDASWIAIGSPTASVTDGDMQSSDTVHVTCSVAANGDGSFQVSAIATLGSTGSVTVTGRFSSSGPQMNVRGVFQRGDTGHFEESDCTASYAANPLMGVAAGRLWATIDCPNAADATQQRTGPNGMPTPRSCHAVAELKLETCAQ